MQARPGFKKWGHILCPNIILSIKIQILCWHEGMARISVRCVWRGQMAIGCTRRLYDRHYWHLWRIRLYVPVSHYCAFDPSWGFNRFGMPINNILIVSRVSADCWNLHDCFVEMLRGNYFVYDSIFLFISRPWWPNS